MKLDEITVLMPVHNAIFYLKEAIESLLQQTILDKVQIFILNDHSTDNSIEVIERINHSRIKIITPPVCGLVSVLNYGLEMVQTEFVARMDSDDISFPTRLEHQLSFLRNNADVGLVGTRGFYIGERSSNRKIPITCPIHHDKIVEALLKRRYAIIHPSILFRKIVVDTVGVYKQDFFPSEDFELFFRIAKRYRLANLPDYYYLKRVRKESIIGEGISQSMNKYNEARILYISNFKMKSPKMIEKILTTSDAFSMSFYQKGLYYYLNKFSVKSSIYIFISIIFNPMRLLDRIKKLLFDNSL